MQTLREYVSGIKFSVRIESVLLSLNTPEISIKKQHLFLPLFEYHIGMIILAGDVKNTTLSVRLLLHEMKVIDYFKREVERNSVNR